MAATAASAIALSACGGGGGGGGGINTTPPPVGSTPTPSPTPAPTPSPAPTSNASLLDLAVTETFTTDAATGGGFYTDSTPCGSCSSARSTVSIRYDAGSRSYTVTQGDRSQSFGASNRDAAQSSAALDVYTKQNGAVQESLSLTRPGTSGALTYRYVGAGMWQRVTVNGNRADFTFDSFTYGVFTPASAMPRTGYAAYDVTLLGALGSTSRLQPIALSGTGLLTTDFARGDIGLSGTITGTNSELPITEFVSSFRGGGQITSNSNAFSGTFSFNNIMNGTLDGRFYGPNADEVGATFAVNSLFGDTAVGSIAGRRGAIQSATALADLTASTDFQSPGAFLIYSRDPATGQLLPPLTSPGISMMSDMSYKRLEGMTYNPASGSYTFDIAPPALISNWGLDLSGLSFGTNNLVAAKSNARFNVYEKQIGDRTLRLTTYRPGSGNDQLALTYTSFAKVEISWPVSAGRESAFEAYLPYGVVTPNSQMPLTGTASYAGRLFGTAASQHDFTSNWSGPRPVDFYDLSGSAGFLADFGAGTLVTTLSPTGVNRTTGATRNFGDFSLTYTFPVGSGRIGSPDYQSGAFFGPTANEVGVTFRIPVRNSSGSDDVVLSGVAVGKRN